ncbi:hypothetical protein CK203_110834 [Vitis vinifera]|uniref:Uncharacterized protein n=1 Tax=Vitis vinifera TaxID=29760 RepID=A0A438BPF1_VITVI|nr:hypothetical protein CK203_110834 [Vitis vinifera]
MGLLTLVSVEKELPPSMFFIDALLHHNIFPLQHWILEHLGYPAEPQLERRRICREIFTLYKWTSMTAYGADQGAPIGPEHPEIPHPEQPEEPQPVEIPVDITTPASVVASTEPIPEEQIIATQTQHTAILRQIQHHLDILSTPEHPIPILSEPTEPSQAPPPIEQTMSSEEPTTGDAEHPP